MPAFLPEGLLWDKQGIKYFTLRRVVGDTESEIGFFDGPERLEDVLNQLIILGYSFDDFGNLKK